ncbi:MAG: matrixin family metalloprotease [Terriglobia bacterium]
MTNETRKAEKQPARLAPVARRGLRAPGFLCSVGIVAAAAALTAIFLFGYTHEQDDVNGPVAAKWCNGNLNSGAPCTYFVNWSLGPQPGPSMVAPGGVGYVQAIQAAFNSWHNATLNGQTVVALTISQGVGSALTSEQVDCQNVVGFTDPASSDFPTGTIAFTSIATSFGCPVAGPNCPTGTPPNTYSCPNSANPAATYTCPLPSCMIDADIEFNPKDTFSTASATPANDFDLQAIATHEVGHLLGLAHSGLGNAIMFAFGDTGGVPNRTLSTDDVLGIGSVYPSSGFASAAGTLSGAVSLSGSGIFGSHVLVIDASSGNAVADTLTNTDGSYSLLVPPGQYNVVALPLAGIYDITDFGGWACGYSENSPPCCDPTSDTTCTGKQLSPPTNYTGKFN